MPKFLVEMTVRAIVEQDAAPIGLADADPIAVAAFVESNALGSSVCTEVTEATDEDVEELDPYDDDEDDHEDDVDDEEYEVEDLDAD